jgi:hypothetical protein
VKKLGNLAVNKEETSLKSERRFRGYSLKWVLAMILVIGLFLQADALAFFFTYGLSMATAIR